MIKDIKVCKLRLSCTAFDDHLNSLDYRGLFHLDKRLNALEAWITKDNSIELVKIEPASADASFRRYFRVHLNPCKRFHNSDTIIAVDAPPEHEDNALFIKCSQILNDCGIHAPAIYESDLEHGFLLIEDLGALTYQAQLENGDANKLYADAKQTLIKLQNSTDKHSKAVSYTHLTLPTKRIV